MAQVLDTDYSSTQRVRDVRTNFIIQIAMDTPVVSMMNKAPKPMSTTPEWPVKTYASPSSSGIVEGVPPTSSDFQNNLANKTMLLGRFQKSWRPVAVSKEANLMGKQYAVPGNTLQDNVKDKTLELHVDVEYTVLSDNESVPAASSGGVGTTASATRSIPRWVSKADARFTDTATTPNTSYRTNSNQIVTSKTLSTDVTEANISGIVVNVATARKKVGTRFLGICQPLMREQFSSFTRTDPNGESSSTFPVRRFNQDQNGTIDYTVTKYKSNFGPIELMNTFRMDSSVWFLLCDPALMELGYAQAPMVMPLPPDGASERTLIDVLFVNEVLNPQAFAKVITGATA